MNVEKIKNLEIYSHNEHHNFVDKNLFIEELLNSLKYKNIAMKLFFIHSPKIAGMVNTDIDLLLIIAIENKDRNYLKIPVNQSINEKYFNNLIIPIKFYSDLSDEIINFPKNSDKAYNILISDDMELSIVTEIKELYSQTKSYLEKIFVKSLNQEEQSDFSISPYPIIWITSPNKECYDFRYKNVIYAPKFGWDELFHHLKWVKFEKNSFYSVYQWSKQESKNKKENYLLIDKQISLLIEQLEKDNKMGSLTKKKIDRLNAKYSEDQKIYERYLAEQENNESDDNDLLSLFSDIPAKKQTKLPNRILAEKGLDKNLIVISGKAGSGKSFEIQTLMKKCYEKSQEEGATHFNSGYYLTYNKLLAKEIRLLTDKYQFNNHRKTVVKTLHQFFWNLSSDGLRILTIMTTPRRQQLEKIEVERYTLLQNMLNTISTPLINLDEDITLSHFSKPDREYILLFINKAKKQYKQNLVDKSRLLEFLDKHHKYNLESLQKSIENNTFLQDYYQVLRYILLARKDPEKLYEELEIENMSDEEWNIVIGNKADYKKTPEDFTKMINRSLGSTIAKGKVLFIDEAQDCHNLERDILLSMWQQRNIVVATGGQDQLIRHDTECNWRFNGELNRPIHNIISIEKRNKTYRMKPALVKLCNFIAAEFQIKLDLSAHNTKTDDEGRVIIELHDPNYLNLKNQVISLQKNEEENGLSPYESILFMSESSSEIFEKIETSNHKVQIDDNDNIIVTVDQYKRKNSKLSFYTGIEEEQFYFHNQVNNHTENEDGDDEEQTLNSDTYRAIFYESCRGLEAWSTVCLDLDLFYQRKYDEEIASTYLSDDILLTVEERKEKYAANWVLMALTRAMDTVYIHLNDANSRLGKVLCKYIAEM